MEIILVVVVLLVLGAAFKLLLKAGKAKADDFTAAGPLTTAAETAFLKVLDQVVARDHRVFSKVRLIDVVRPSRDVPAARNRVISKHLDFVVCDATTMKILYAVELNDRSHESARRQARDKFVTAAMKSAGIPIVWVKAQRAYSIDELRNQIPQGLSLPPGAASPPASTAPAPANNPVTGKPLRGAVELQRPRG